MNMPRMLGTMLRMVGAKAGMVAATAFLVERKVPAVVCIVTRLA